MVSTLPAAGEPAETSWGIWIVARKTMTRLGGVVVVAAAALAVAAWVSRASPVAPASLPCGQWPIGQGTASPTPMVAPTPSERQTSALRVVPIGAWATCFRPAVVTISAGATIQWQQVDLGQYRVVLDSGPQFGPIRHVLEVRFNRPGTYHYHGDQSSDVTGTIVVVGTPQPGPEFAIR